MEGKRGSAPTRMRRSSSRSKRRDRSLPTTPMKPGASPHCGISTVPAEAASSRIAWVLATSSVRSK
ncbi:Uncharacterised protein [Bordetella pertussis]|nr:Uncharacterised protein [Bordetella pertussis]